MIRNNIRESGIMWKILWNKYVFLLLLLLIAVGGITVTLKCCAAKQRAEEYTGTPEQDREIAEEMTAVFSPGHGLAERVLVVQQLRPTLNKMPREKRQVMQVNAVLTAVDRSLVRLSALPPEEKTKQIKLICEDAVLFHDTFRKLPQDKQRRIREIMTSGAGRERFHQLNATITTGLSPADREALGPAIKSWHEMLKGKTQ